MSRRTIHLDTAGAKIGLAAACLIWIVISFFFMRWDLAAAVANRGLDPGQPDSRVMADWLRENAPDDPFARMVTARYFERTFEPDDMTRSLVDLEAATALSPKNFGLWLRLGASRNANGDLAGAEQAYRRSLELAPAYAAVQWSYGNFLIRHGNTREGFDLVAEAVKSNRSYSNFAASLALSVFDGNPDEVRRVLGDTADINSGIASVFSSQKKYKEAYDAWSQIEASEKTGRFAELGRQLMGRSLESHETRIAAEIAGDLGAADSPRPVVGQITNGGFENGVKLRNAPIFEWQISEGGEPQIGLSESVKRTGRYSLWLTFDSFEAAEFRSISQTVAVVPSGNYELEGFYRADIKSKALFKWEVIDSLSAASLATTDPLTLNGDWAAFRVKFTMPSSSDGILVRFIRTGCTGAACPVTGKISFDDISLRQL